MVVLRAEFVFSARFDAGNAVLAQNIIEIAEN